MQKQHFIEQMLAIGIVQYHEQETLWRMANRCARTLGAVGAGTGFVWGAGAGSVVVPGIGAIPGSVAGALAGFWKGTLMCVAVNAATRAQLRSLAKEASTVDLTDLESAR
jgi:uncharacterized membrane protein